MSAGSDHEPHRPIPKRLRQIEICVLSGDGEAIHSQIIFKLQLPRVLTAMLAGGALGIGGVLMQALFRNRIALNAHMSEADWRSRQDLLL